MKSAMSPGKKPKRAGKKTAELTATAEFEKLLRTASPKGQYVLRLYITGNTVRSGQAIANIRSLCDDYLSGRYDLEVIDICQQPTEAAKCQIIAAPTLIKEVPIPVKRIVGDLSSRDKVLVGLDLQKSEGGAKKSAGTKWVNL